MIVGELDFYTRTREHFKGEAVPEALFEATWDLLCGTLFK